MFLSLYLLQRHLFLLEPFFSMHWLGSCAPAMLLILARFHICNDVNHGNMKVGAAECTFQSPGDDGKKIPNQDDLKRCVGFRAGTKWRERRKLLPSNKNLMAICEDFSHTFLFPKSFLSITIISLRGVIKYNLI